MTETIQPAALTWKEITQLEPRLEVLYRKAKNVRRANRRLAQHNDRVAESDNAGPGVFYLSGAIGLRQRDHSHPDNPT